MCIGQALLRVNAVLERSGMTLTRMEILWVYTRGSPRSRDLHL